MDELKLEKFCYEHDDCNNCPFREECDKYYGKHHVLPMKRYKKKGENNNGNS